MSFDGTQSSLVEHFCPFQACDCHKCAFFSEHRSVLPAESALNKEQGAHLKRHLAQGLTRSGASLPKAHGHVTKLTIQAGVISECLWPGRTSEFGASTQGALLTGQAPKPLSPSWTPAALRMQLTISVSRKTHRIPALRSGEAWVFASHPLTPFPWQAPEASDQDLVSASEWQRKLEAAEALLILRDSTQESSGSIFLLQPCVAAGSPVLERRTWSGGDGWEMGGHCGKQGLQPPSPSLRPRPATTISLPIGHLGCISLLS
uniref:DMRT like family C1B n=1 Tax=Canis lupus dingo TaxID=286419 RepID=A0A8C0LIL0_CANLU